MTPAGSLGALPRGSQGDAPDNVVQQMEAELRARRAPTEVEQLLAAAEARTEALGAALETAYRFAWRFGVHHQPCPLAINIDAPADTSCTCGYDVAAGALMDAEEALGFDFWKNARAAATAGGADA